MLKNIDIQNLIDDEYVPSSVERKKSVLMYFFVGIVLVLVGDKVSVYEFYHLKQALGRWLLFFLTLVCTVLFIFIPYLRIIPVLLFLFYLVLWSIFVKQAREGKYALYENNILMPFFFGLGSWVIQMFEINIIKE